jgi:hypothetical protein
MTPCDILPQIRTGEMTGTVESRVKVGQWAVFFEQSALSLGPLSRHSFTLRRDGGRHIDGVLS